MVTSNIILVLDAKLYKFSQVREFMMFRDFDGRHYELIRASDVVRDGMWLELWDCAAGCDDYVLAAFYCDHTERMTFSAQCQEPLDLVDWFIQKAHEVLPLVKEIPTPQSQR